MNHRTRTQAILIAPFFLPLLTGCAEPWQFAENKFSDCCAQPTCCSAPPERFLPETTLNTDSLLVHNEAGSGSE